jgi:hypothetical protein
MGTKLARAWAWLAVLLPAAFGALMLVNPQTIVATMPVEHVAHMVGIRNLVHSALLAAALVMFPARVVGLLVAGRGLTDFADFVVSVVGTGTVTGQTLFPLITSLVSFTAAFVLYSKTPGASKGSYV